MVTVTARQGDGGLVPEWDEDQEAAWTIARAYDSPAFRLYRMRLPEGAVPRVPLAEGKVVWRTPGGRAFRFRAPAKVVGSGPGYALVLLDDPSLAPLNAVVEMQEGARSGRLKFPDDVEVTLALEDAA